MAPFPESRVFDPAETLPREALRRLQLSRLRESIERAATPAAERAAA
jgi:hypothetical protein